MIVPIAFGKITPPLNVGFIEKFNGILSAKQFLLFSLFVTFDSFGLGVRKPSFASVSLFTRAVNFHTPVYLRSCRFFLTNNKHRVK